MKTFYFKTGVDTRIYPSSQANIPFDCDNVPEGAKFKFACDNPNLHPESGYIVREMHNTTMLSKYAYFTA